MTRPSLLASAIGRLAAARALANEIGGVTAARIYIQVGDDGPTYELGRINASRHMSNEEIKGSIHRLLVAIAERWKT